MISNKSSQNRKQLQGVQQSQIICQNEIICNITVSSRNQLQQNKSAVPISQSPQNPKSERYKHAFKEGEESQKRDIQGLTKANEYLRECLRDLNFFVGKKLEKQKDSIYQRYNSQSNIGNVPKKSEEQVVEQQLTVLEQEYKNNAFILQQQEKELKSIEQKMSGMHVNSQYELVQQIEKLQDKIKEEKLEIKSSRQFNFLEGKYLDNIVNNKKLPQVVESQQNKQLDALKLQYANQKLKDQLQKKQDLISDYNKKITALDKDYNEVLRKEKSLKIVDQELLGKIKVERKKVNQFEDNINLLNHNLEREQLKYENISKDLNTLIQHTDDKINTIEMQIRQLNSDGQQLRDIGKEVSGTFLTRFPSQDDPSNFENAEEMMEVADNDKEQSKNPKSFQPMKSNKPTYPKKPAKITQSGIALKNSQKNSNLNSKKKELKSTDELDNFKLPSSRQKKDESTPQMSQNKLSSQINKQEDEDYQIKSVPKQQQEQAQKYQNEEGKHLNTNEGLKILDDIDHLIEKQSNSKQQSPSKSSKQAQSPQYMSKQQSDIDEMDQDDLKQNLNKSQEKQVQKTQKVDLSQNYNEESNKDKSVDNNQLDIDEDDEDLEKIEEEIRKLQEEEKKQQELKEKQQVKELPKVETEPTKKKVAQKETSFTQTDDIDNDQTLFQYKNNQSLENIKEEKEKNNENKQQHSQNQSQRASMDKVNTSTQNNDAKQSQQQSQNQSQRASMDKVNTPTQNNDIKQQQYQSQNQSQRASMDKVNTPTQNNDIKQQQNQSQNQNQRASMDKINASTQNNDVKQQMDQSNSQQKKSVANIEPLKQNNVEPLKQNNGITQKSQMNYDNFDDFSDDLGSNNKVTNQVQQSSQFKQANNQNNQSNTQQQSGNKVNNQQQQSNQNNKFDDTDFDDLLKF